MSDIIQTAQDLRSELKSERKDWIRERGGEYIEMPLDCTVMYGDEDAREVIGALAEETWEYAVEEKWLTPLGAVWRLATETQWHSSYHAAEESADPECHTRIVRRRVSPPEVTNE